MARTTRIARLRRGGRIAGLLLALIALVQCGQAEVPAPNPTPEAAKPTLADDQVFVERQGGTLTLNGRPFRFAGTNVYWLGLDENVGGIDYPTEFRVDDVLATAREMGATVIRSHAAVSVGCPRCIKPDQASVNEVALRHVDYAVAAARRYGLRLILPLVDNYAYYHGGYHTFADWRGLPKEAFYTDRKTIADFKAYVSLILNRVNTYTGVAYKDDPTIMAWETGNELRPPPQWTGEIADLIKGIAPRQLVADGSIEIDPTALSLPGVDMYSLHFYPMDRLVLVRSADQVAAAGKVFFVGEYDWNNIKGGDSLPRFLDAVRRTPAVSGDLYWTLLGHNDPYGYVYSNGGYKMHYPGETPNMRERAQSLREHAYAMRGVSPPAHITPAAPSITGGGAALTWRGVTGADTYTVERSSVGPYGPWQVICDRCATDYDTPWALPNAAAGPAWYRVRAYNLSGEAGPASPAYLSR